MTGESSSAILGSSGKDLIALGEVMLRLDPGETRIRSARRFEVWEGGGEYNVARSLSTTFGFTTAIVTALVDNEIGRLIEGLIRSSGVDTSSITWRDFDGIGSTARNGINFLERGYGIRGALGVSDRGHTASSKMDFTDTNWATLFSNNACGWFHTGGIFAGLSEMSENTAIAALELARHYSVTTSVDLNFRPSLWKHQAHRVPQRVFTRLVSNADLVIGGETDFVERLHIPVSTAPTFIGRFSELACKLLDKFPTVRVVACSERISHSASRNYWRGHAYSQADGLVSSREFDDLEILDRVGGGDGLAAGLIFGLRTGRTLRESINIGAASGALVMTTPGDGSMASLSEVLDVASGERAKTNR